MLSLVNDIIDMSKLETGQHVLNEVEFDLEDVIAESVSLIRGRAERDRHPIELRLEAWPRLKADERALRQILVNLLTNALKFSNQGGRVEIETAIVEGDSNNLHIRVRDHGIGIDDADLARLGKPFMQLKPGRDLGEGSGLGLTITRYLAELHGGRIEITSTLGKGTTATFVLPASRIVIRDTLAHRRKEATR
jgi:signal transduction histidine kinase